MIVDGLDDAPSKTGEIAQRIVDQVLRAAGRREHARGSHVSVMPIGEPGVGRTATAEGPARRIEFEPERVPVRLRDSTSSTCR